MRANLLAFTTVVAFAAPAAAQVYIPIPVSGYTDDVIGDAVGTASGTTTATIDFGFEPEDNNVFFEHGYVTGGPSTGLPPTGAIVTSATRVYQLGPISGNNSLRITRTNPAGTLTLVAPAREAALSLLLTAGDALTRGNVGFLGSVTVNWSDGQSSTFPYRVYDWWENMTPVPPPGVAIGGLNRVDRATGMPIALDGNVHALFAIYYYDIDLTGDPNYQAGALVDGLTFGWPSSVTTYYDLTLNVMGLSGATAVPEPSTLFLTAAVGIAGFLSRRRKAG
ncbi:MAG TPA: PEP-CTERM sorting domain-containing protein [Gemmataceae bacterium]|nr:PEP-CTERM sorting domain-containing protein [Gemmataceae bacterium]